MDMEFEWDKRRGFIALGNFFAQGDAYDDITQSAGIDDLDGDEEAKKKLLDFLTSAGWKFEDNLADDYIKAEKEDEI